jgi:hypothetical protein
MAKSGSDLPGKVHMKGSEKELLSLRKSRVRREEKV